MFAAAEGKSNLGIPKATAAEFLSSAIGHPGSIKDLPARVSKKRPTKPKKAKP